MKPTMILVPVIEPLDIRRCNVFEHTALDFYRYGEYPRFLRPVGAHRPRVAVRVVKEPANPIPLPSTTP